MTEHIYQWLDLVWLPVAWFVVHRNHRWMALGFILTCALTLRTQVELMKSVGFETGILPLLNGPLMARGMIAYGIAIALYLILAHFSQGTSKMIFLTASITIYIVTFCLTMILMLL